MREVVLPILLCMVFRAIPVEAQSVVTPVAYTGSGSLYTQNFDGLPGTGTFALTGKGPVNLSSGPINGTDLQGWQILMSAGTNTNAAFATGTGSSTGNGVYSLGSTGTGERALGSLSSSAGIYAMGLVLTNQTGGILNSFTLSFTAEQWRKGGSGNKNTWSFHYKTGVIGHIDQPGMADEPHLNFSSLISTTGAATLNGNLPENRQAISFTINGITWRPGEQLLLRWDDADESGSDDVVGLDNLSFSASLASGPPLIISSGISNITSASADWSGSVNDNFAATALQLEYDTSNPFSTPLSVRTLPDTLEVGSGNTTISARLTGLSSATTYYFRLKANNENGAVVSTVQNFTTQIALPTVTTRAASAVTTNTALLGGNITATGGGEITEKGIVWSPGGIPSLSDNKIILGTGPGAFAQLITGLPQGTIIYARAYAINTGGIAYGDTIRFITPTVITSFNTTSLASANTLTVAFSLQTAQNISGLSPANFSITGNGIIEAGITSVTGSANSFTITVSTGTGNGTLGLNLTNDAGLSIPIINKPFASANYYTIDKTAPQVTMVSIPDKPMKVGDTIEVTIAVKPDPDSYKMTSGNIDVFNLTGLIKKDDSTHLCSFIISNGGNDIAGEADIPVNISLTDRAGNRGLYQAVIRQSSDPIDANKPFIAMIRNPANGIYKAGDTLFFTCRFTEKIFVSGGVPSVSLTVGTGTRTAVYIKGNGSDSLLFRYIISAGSLDMDGIKTAGTITLNNATIKDSAGNIATVGFNNTLATKDILIDAVIPLINEITVPVNAVYRTGNILDFVVNYSKKVFVSDAALPSLVLTIGNKNKNALFINGSGSNSLLFRYTIQPDDIDADGIQLVSLQDSLFMIRDSVGNRPSAVLGNIANMSGLQVNPPSIRFENMVTPANDVYRIGDTLEFFIAYNEPVFIANGVPSLKITIGSTARQAIYTDGSGTATIRFVYIIEPGDEDTDGIRINNSLTLNNSIIKDAQGNNAPLIVNNTANGIGILVDGVVPLITAVQTSPGRTYKAGDTIRVLVNYSETVFLPAKADPPTIKFTIGSEEKNMLYTKGFGSNEWLFSYVIQTGDLDRNGISIGSSIVTNGYLLTDKAGNSASLSFKTVSGSSIRIDAVPPVITAVKPPSSSAYTTGDIIEFMVTYSKKIFVSDTGQRPSLTIDMDDNIKTANYVSGSGSNTLSFRYTVQKDDRDIDGIRLISPLNDYASIIKDSVGNPANATFISPGTIAGVQVNLPPIFVQSLTIPFKGVYKAGDTLDLYTRYNDRIFVATSAGTPSITISIGSNNRQAVYINDTTQNTLHFRYIIQAGDGDAKGIMISSSISLNNATIRGTLGNPAMINLPIVNTKDIIVDAVAPVVNRVQLPADGIYKAGDTLKLVLHFSEPVKLTGKNDTAAVRITIGTVAKNIWYHKGSGNDELHFIYIVQSGDLDKNGIVLGTSVLLNNNTLTDTIGNTAVNAFKINASLANIKVDAVSPVFTQAKTDTIQVCAGSAPLTISNAFAVTDEEAGELISWKIKNTTKYGTLSLLVYTAGSTGKNVIPAGIQYTPNAGGTGVDSIITEITDGTNNAEKMIIVLISPPVRNNMIGSAQLICAGQVPLPFTGTQPMGGNGTWKYTWEVSTDSMRFGIVTGTSTDAVYAPPPLTTHTWFRRKVISGPCSDTSAPVKITVAKNGLWTGADNNDWNNAKNWCGNLVPNDSDTVQVYPNKAFMPMVNDTARCNQLTIYPGAYLTIDRILSVSGKINSDDHSINAANGTIIFEGPATQHLNGKIFENNTVKHLVINNEQGVSLSGELVIDGSLSLTNGYLQTNDQLMLRKDAFISATADGNEVRGKVYLEHLIRGGRRAFHIFGNPFSNDLNLEMIRDSLDITGENGYPNGFTPTPTNQPSAFRYDTFAGNDSAGIEAGWIPFTNTNGSSGNLWKKHSGIRLLMRGKHGEGLDGTPPGDGKNGTYLPGEVVLKLSGNINTGDQEMVLQKNAYPTYHVVANPYVCNIDVSSITRGNDIGNYFWIWDPLQGIQGGYTSFPFSSKYITPPLGAFIAKSNGNLDNRLLFTERSKSMDAFTHTVPVLQADDMFYLELRLETDSIFWDRIVFLQMDSAKTGFDKNDAEKFMNNDVNFYSVSREQKMLSIDARPFNNNSVIPLGIQAKGPGKFTIRVAKQKLSASNALMLHDKLLDAWTVLAEDSIYRFTTTYDTAGAGTNRFEICSRKEPVDTMAAKLTITIKASPVPAKHQILVKFSSPNAGNSSIRLLTLTGYPVKTIQLGVQKEGQLLIPVQELLSGMYILEVRCGDKTGTTKIIKD